ncbi:aconitase X swivel domain-containing protein [Butyrivibrio proteoclasticus]|uniref:aconitase X swivel domain-containing protein n=1 Tax=Butyrivibrio proteoclasticus TaxID=43305 RepID=UPI00047DDE11|nr:DUF126 domain-containing protein [Butyrivibrio proteoclasticus]
MKEFKGRVVIPGQCSATALVSHKGFNTLASYQTSFLTGDKKATCSDQNNEDLYKKPMAGVALCIPQTIGSTTGGMILFTAADYGRQPACMLFANPIDSIGAAGVLLADIWTDAKMPTIDSLGEEFLSYVKSGMTITIKDGGIVQVAD